VPPKRLGDILRELREARGLTEAQLAERAQIALSFITLIEAHQQARPSTQILQRIARALGVPVKRLEGTEN
jgi:transcriptional regulator with XRE-family HTH domain